MTYGLRYPALALSIGAAIVTAGVATAQTRGVSKDEIVLGLHTDLSGVAAFYGVSSTNGIRMRIDEVNEAGGINGRKVRLIVEDTQYQVPRAVQAANKLINRDKVFAFVGPLGTPMNNAVLKDQLGAGVPNMFPLSAARSMYEPFHPLKFAGGYSYYDQVRAGIKYMVEVKGKKNICALYQDTDFGQEILEGARDQAESMKLKLVDSATSKPTDTDFTAQITKLRASNCDIVALGTIIRDSIQAYGTARKLGWAEVDFMGTSASYDFPVAAVPGGVTEGFYSVAGIILPYPETATPEAKAWMDRYKAKFNADINSGSIYGYNFMDLVVVGLDRAGKNVTVDSFIKGMESISNYRDIFGGPMANLGPKTRRATDTAFLSQVQKGRWAPVTNAIAY